MYHPVGVSKLSDTQKSRLRNGHPVRIKKGTANKLHLTQEQIKKLESAHRRGAAYTIQLNPEQAKQHGSGLMGDIATKLKKMANKHKNIINPVILAVKNAGHQGLQKVASNLHNKINNIPELSGEGIKKRGRPSKGSGLLGDALSFINPTIGGVAKTFGLGVKKTRKPRAKKGKGFLTGMAKELGPMIIDVAANAAKNKVAGMGVVKRKVGRPKKTRTGASLMPAGAGLKRKTKKRTKRGTSLKPAGY